MSVTSPSAPVLVHLQPVTDAQHAVGGELDTATRPRMGSLNTSIRTAVMAPRPLNRKRGDLPSSRAIIRMPTRMLATSFTPGRCRAGQIPLKPGMAAQESRQSSRANRASSRNSRIQSWASNPISARLSDALGSQISA